MKNICQEILSITYLLTMLILNSCDTTEPQPANFHNKILFTSSRSGKEQLYMMNPDGTNIMQLTSGQYWHNNGRWSPDAQKIVCNTEEGTSTAGFEMVVMNSDGSNRKLLGYGNQMSWYPDGSRILYTYSALEVGDYWAKLYGISPNGKNKDIISDQYAGYNTISPDGLKIAFSYNSDTLKSIVILDYPLINNPIFIQTEQRGLPYAPNWSSDGNEITFSISPNIYCSSTDGSSLRQITENDSNMPYIYPRWAPDGKKIIFLAYTVDNTQKCYIYMINKDGTNLLRVIDDETVTSCDWSK